MCHPSWCIVPRRPCTSWILAWAEQRAVLEAQIASLGEGADEIVLVNSHGHFDHLCSTTFTAMLRETGHSGTLLASRHQFRVGRGRRFRRMRRRPVQTWQGAAWPHKRTPSRPAPTLHTANRSEGSSQIAMAAAIAMPPGTRNPRATPGDGWVAEKLAGNRIETLDRGPFWRGLGRSPSFNRLQQSPLCGKPIHRMQDECLGLA